MPAKAPAKKKEGRKVDFALIDLAKINYEPDEYFTADEALKCLMKSLVIKTRETILNQLKDTTLVYGMSSLADRTIRPLHYLLHMVDLKKNKEIRYVLTNTYWFMTPDRMKAKYNFNHRMEYTFMVQLLPKVHPRDFTKHYHIDEALTFRALFKNKACKQSVYDLFKEKQGMILYADTDEESAVHAGEIFDIGYFYEVMHLRRELDFKEPPKYKKFNAFLRKRGFPEEGRVILPKYLKEFDPEPRWYGRREHRVYTGNFNTKGWTIEDMKKKKLVDCQPLFKYFPHKTKGNLKMVDDVWLSVVGQRNVFEIFSCRMHVQFKKELGKLHLIDGSEKEKLYLSCFLICLYFGHCDLHTFDTVYEIMEYIRSQSSFVSNLLNINSQGIDKKTYKLPCCSNPEHHMSMGPYQVMVNYRRVILVNEDNDGECCYRWMMQKCLPQLPIMND